MLRVIRDDGTEFEDSPTEMTVRALHDVRFSHSWSQRTQDLGETLVIQLLDERAIFIGCWCAAI